MFSLFKIAQILLPHSKRTTRMKAWVKVFVSYLQMLAEHHRHYRLTSFIEANMTPQVIYIEGMLNRRYGTTSIRLIEGYEIGVWAFPSEENGEQYYDDPDAYIFSDNDETVIAFQCEIPSSLQSESQTIISMINRYKLLGKKFVIKIV